MLERPTPVPIAEDSPMKSEALSKTLIGRPDASTIDVTSPHAVVVG